MQRKQSVSTTCVSGWAQLMKRPLLALLILCFWCALAHGQSLARRDRDSGQVIKDATADQVLAARAIFLLKRLDDDVIVYRSLGAFEEGGKLARVPFETFRTDLSEVSAEVDAITSRLPSGRLKTEIRNTLASYRDGAFWWQKITEPRVVHASALQSTGIEMTPSDSFFTASIPYTVAIHWRNAYKHLQRAAQQAVQSSPKSAFVE